MAEIKLERKRTNPIVWILPLLLIALAAWWILGRNDRADDSRGTPPTTFRQPVSVLAYHANALATAIADAA